MTGIQSHYREGRKVQEVERSRIEYVCSCGYITLKPACSLENENGGLTVKRSRVRIIDDETGNIIMRLKPRRKDFIRVGGCNACENGWK
jgi:hypothetical protein